MRSPATRHGCPAARPERRSLTSSPHRRRRAGDTSAGDLKRPPAAAAAQIVGAAHQLGGIDRSGAIDLPAIGAEFFDLVAAIAPPGQQILDRVRPAKPARRQARIGSSIRRCLARYQAPARTRYLTALTARQGLCSLSPCRHLLGRSRTGRRRRGGRPAGPSRPPARLLPRAAVVRARVAPVLRRFLRSEWLRVSPRRHALRRTFAGPWSRWRFQPHLRPLLIVPPRPPPPRRGCGRRWPGRSRPAARSRPSRRPPPAARTHRPPSPAPSACARHTSPRPWPWLSLRARVSTQGQRPAPALGSG